MGWDSEVRTQPSLTHTRSYVAKRTAEGKSKKEIIRCLKL
jgi:DNA-binding CsgD family transcriptional regulator